MRSAVAELKRRILELKKRSSSHLKADIFDLERDVDELKKISENFTEEKIQETFKRYTANFEETKIKINRVREERQSAKESQRLAKSMLGSIQEDFYARLEASCRVLKNYMHYAFKQRYTPSKTKEIEEEHPKREKKLIEHQNIQTDRSDLLTELQQQTEKLLVCKERFHNLPERIQPKEPIEANNILVKLHQDSARLRRINSRIDLLNLASKFKPLLIPSPEVVSREPTITREEFEEFREEFGKRVEEIGREIEEDKETAENRIACIRKRLETVRERIESLTYVDSDLAGLVAEIEVTLIDLSKTKSPKPQKWDGVDEFTVARASASVRLLTEWTKARLNDLKEKGKRAQKRVSLC